LLCRLYCDCDCSGKYGCITWSLFFKILLNSASSELLNSSVLPYGVRNTEPNRRSSVTGTDPHNVLRTAFRSDPDTKSPLTYNHLAHVTVDRLATGAAWSLRDCVLYSIACARRRCVGSFVNRCPKSEYGDVLRISATKIRSRNFSTLCNSSTSQLATLVWLTLPGTIDVKNFD